MPPQVKRLPLSEFKTIAKDGSAEGQQILIPKAYNCETKDVDGQDDTLEFVISTGIVDRDQDTVNPQGWRLENFAKGGVVLWAHDSRLPPIANPRGAWLEDNKLVSRAKFNPADMDHPLGMGFGQTIKRMYRERIMKSTSVGFIPIKWNWNEERGSWAVDFDEQELLEYSAVPVPANPEALVRLGFDTAPLFSWAERCLDGGMTLMVPRSDIESFHKALRGHHGKPQPTIVQLTLPSVKSAKDFAAKLAGLPDDNPPKEVKKPITWQSAHPDGTSVADRDDEWNGPAEVAAAEVDDLKVMSTWVDEENDDTKGAYKLQHHKASGHAVVWRGVTASMGALLGARGGVDIPDNERQGTYDHIAQHYTEDFEEEPPELRDYDEGDLKEMFPELYPEDPPDDGDADDDIEQLLASAGEALIKSAEAIAKRGRVISAANEERLRGARDAIDGVLSQLESQGDDDGDDDKAPGEDEIEISQEGLEELRGTIREAVQAEICKSTGALS